MLDEILTDAYNDLAGDEIQEDSECIEIGSYIGASQNVLKAFMSDQKIELNEDGYYRNEHCGIKLTDDGDLYIMVLIDDYYSIFGSTIGETFTYGHL